MKIFFAADNPNAFLHGIHFHRVTVPISGLDKRGHGTAIIVPGDNTGEDALNWPDVVVFARTYHPNQKPIELMRQFKAHGKRIVWDIDDDFWAVNPDNPSILVSNAYKDQYETFVREADAITTPSEVLAAKMRKLTKKPIFICPNAIDFRRYQERPKMHNELIVGYAGASSHWGDLNLIGDVILKLQEKYEFAFVLYGLMGAPIESEMYVMQELLRRNSTPEKNPYYTNALKWWEKMRMIKVYPHIPFHVPFYTPLLHPFKLSSLDFDIGIAPLEDNEFNRAKSCVKFYEYAATGSVTLASDVVPYSKEVGYCAKNTIDDWYKKLERLIADKNFREELYQKQRKWVEENRSIEKVALAWELALQAPGGLKVLNQRENYTPTIQPSSI